MPFAVPAGRLQQLRGSKDSAKLEELRSKLSKDLAENDEFFEDMESEEAEGELTGCLGLVLRLIMGKKKFEESNQRAKTAGPVPSSSDLLGAFINGEALDLRCGSKMGYVLKLICQAEGTFLLNAGLESIRRGEKWVAEVEKELKTYGVQLELDKNSFGQESVLGVLEPDDFPGIGYFPYELWKKNDVKLQLIDTSKVKIPSYLTDEEDGDDDEETESSEPTNYALLSIKSIQQWSSAAVNGNCDVVTFYH